ncbi:anthranilate synthase component II (plasmid) [Legionella adelaidensis]|uniref:Anthranilate synthase component II n=1 Tax=Legionella adelaidensis TaxID=45056 RepID=A0A0W0R3W6_9GAMM|nr:aminodeoxychorismate/anthranilate synthase component II [Legionella adelaidensis]KTC65724.1 anthranilate synthase component II [Legionella adelaidensis]VEH85110.1 anthranilate synthase component II [Legionella adelaidensis]
MILIIDNYDSFTYNLVQYFRCLQQEVVVHLNDQITIEQIESLNPNSLVISPGPNAPDDAGISLAAITHFYKKIPILGICLGHQAIAQAFGASIVSAKEIMHGKTSAIEHNNQGLFHTLPQHFQVTRYHSLAIEPQSLPPDLRVDAWSKETIMAISHRSLPVFGLQFHPEAILTEHGMDVLSHFLSYQYERSV